jgi:hypothetical protein
MMSKQLQLAVFISYVILKLGGVLIIGVEDAELITGVRQLL